MQLTPAKLQGLADAAQAVAAAGAALAAAAAVHRDSLRLYEDAVERLRTAADEVGVRVPVYALEAADLTREPEPEPVGPEVAA